MRECPECGGIGERWDRDANKPYTCPDCDGAGLLAECDDCGIVFPWSSDYEEWDNGDELCPECYSKRWLREYDELPPKYEHLFNEEAMRKETS